MTIWKKTKHPGVRFKEPGTRKHKGRPDKYYVIRYKRQGVLFEEGVGWESAGITPQYCSNLRGEIVTNFRSGAGHQSLREKRENDEARRQAEMEEQQAVEKENTPFDALARRYLEWSEDNKASWKEDESRYRLHVKPAIGSIPIRQIGVLHLERLKKALKAKGKSSQTILHCLSLIRSMFYMAPDWNLFNGPNPVREAAKKNKKFLKINDTYRLRFFSHEQADRLLAELHARSPQLHDMALLSLHTGMRAGEIFGLQWADVDTRNEIITIRNPKNDETRRAYMTSPVKTIFEKLRPDLVRRNSLVFTNRKEQQIREVSNAFERAVDKLKINEGITDRRDKLVFHSLRHTYGSWLAMQGTPILTIKELMGHKKIEMTMKYSHLLEDHKKEAVLQLAETHSKNKVVEIKKRKTRG